MQLNPARGRKPIINLPSQLEDVVRGLCSSTPRGDGNSTNPIPSVAFTMVYAAQPREGTETLPILTWDASDEYGLCSSTPRGDGNWHAIHYTIIHDGIRFMQLNPARGRKPGEYLLYQGAFQRGLCSSTPRGDGNSAWSRESSHVMRGGLCSSTPRGDGNCAHLGIGIAA